MGIYWGLGLHTYLHLYKVSGIWWPFCVFVLDPWYCGPGGRLLVLIKVLFFYIFEFFFFFLFGCAQVICAAFLLCQFRPTFAKVRREIRVGPTAVLVMEQLPAHLRNIVSNYILINITYFAQIEYYFKC